MQYNSPKVTLNCLNCSTDESLWQERNYLSETAQLTHVTYWKPINSQFDVNKVVIFSYENFVWLSNELMRPSKWPMWSWKRGINWLNIGQQCIDCEKQLNILQAIFWARLSKPGVRQEFFAFYLT